MDALVAALTTSGKYEHHGLEIPPGGVTPQGSSTPQSLWSVSARAPGAAATPPTTPGAVPTNATSGALPFTNPAGADLAYLAQMDFEGSVAGTLVLYDRLYHCSGLSGTVTTPQNVDPTPTNPVNRGPGVGGEPGNLGDDVGLWIECYTALGVTGTTIVASYTNEQGVAGRTTPTPSSSNIPSSMAAGRMIQLPLQAGDRGVQSVQTVTLGGSTGTAGNFGVTLVHRLAEITCEASGVGDTYDLFRLGFPRIYPNACLAAFLYASTGAAQSLRGGYSVVKG